MAILDKKKIDEQLDKQPTQGNTGFTKRKHAAQRWSLVDAPFLALMSTQARSLIHADIRKWESDLYTYDIFPPSENTDWAIARAVKVEQV